MKQIIREKLHALLDMMIDNKPTDAVVGCASGGAKRVDGETGYGLVLIFHPNAIELANSCKRSLGMLVALMEGADCLHFTGPSNDDVTEKINERIRQAHTPKPPSKN